MERKHRLDLEKLEEKTKANSIDVPNMVTYSQEEITKILNDAEMNEDQA